MLLRRERDWVLSEFKAGRSPILIATDVASRGLGMFPVFVLSAATSPQCATSRLPQSGMPVTQLPTAVGVTAVGSYSLHRSLGRICSKTGEATRARIETWSDFPKRVRMVPSDPCLMDYRCFAPASGGASLRLLLALVAAATISDAIVVMDSNGVPGTEAFACFSTSASAYKTSLSPARTRFASTYAFASEVEVTL